MIKNSSRNPQQNSRPNSEAESEEKFTDFFCWARALKFFGVLPGMGWGQNWLCCLSLGTNRKHVNRITRKFQENAENAGTVPGQSRDNLLKLLFMCFLPSLFFLPSLGPIRSARIADAPNTLLILAQQRRAKFLKVLVELCGRRLVNLADLVENLEIRLCPSPLRWPDSRESIRRFARIAWFSRIVSGFPDWTPFLRISVSSKRCFRKRRRQ